MTVQLFIPCFVDQLFPQTAFNMVKVLEKAGVEVEYNEEQTCCGQPAFNAGFRDEARDVCSKFLKDFSGSEFVVAPSASCVGYGSLPPLGSVGNSGRRSFSGPGIANCDLTLQKSTRLTESTSLELRLEAFNAFNHAQFYGPNSVDGNISSATFGNVVSAAPPRLIQIAAKIFF